MKLHESEDDITNVLKEEPEAPGAAGSQHAINANDFSVDTLESPPAAAEAPDAPVAPAAEVKKETVTTTEKKTDANGNTIVEKTVVQVQQPVASSEKSAAIARLFNPDTALLMFDIILTRAGGIFTPDRPREYWALTAQDKKDLGLLAREAAAEEGWTGIPTKYLLFGALGLMIGGKVVYANNMKFQFVPGERPGDNKNPQSGSDNSSTPKNDNDYKSLFIREKAKYEAEQGFKNNSAEVAELRKQNEYLLSMIEKAAANKTNTSGISDVDFEEIKNTTAKQPVYNDHGDYIFKDSQGVKWNLDKTEFTEREALLDLTKAGMPGWSNSGIKLGNISAGQHEAFAEWKRYRKSKKVAA